MNRRVAVFLLAALATLGAPSIVAAAEAALAATVIPGKEIDVAGSGFPSNADVLLVIERNGADAGSQALTTDATGSFSATIDAGPGRGGVYTMTATSGSVTATVEALAVETAGGLQPTPPPTDVAADDRPQSTAADRWTIGVVAVLIGLVLAAAYRRRQSVPGAG